MYLLHMTEVVLVCVLRASWVGAPARAWGVPRLRGTPTDAVGDCACGGNATGMLGVACWAMAHACSAPPTGTRRGAAAGLGPTPGAGERPRGPRGVPSSPPSDLVVSDMCLAAHGPPLPSGSPCRRYVCIVGTAQAARISAYPRCCAAVRLLTCTPIRGDHASAQALPRPGSAAGLSTGAALTVGHHQPLTQPKGHCASNVRPFDVASLTSPGRRRHADGLPAALTPVGSHSRSSAAAPTRAEPIRSSSSSSTWQGSGFPRPAAAQHGRSCSRQQAGIDRLRYSQANPYVLRQPPRGSRLGGSAERVGS